MFRTIRGKELLSSLVFTLGTGLVAALLTGDQIAVYQLLDKPPLSPPGWVFGVVWTVLYILMGVSLYFLRIAKHPQREKALFWFYLQLILNFLWPVFFFSLGLYCFSALWLALLLAAVAVTVYWAFSVAKISGFLLIPYLLWCIFALYLNLGICVL